MWKDRLRAFRQLCTEKRQLQEKLLDVEGRLYAPSGQKFSPVQYGHSGDGHGLENLAAEHLQLLDDYWCQIAAIDREQHSIEAALQVLSPVQRMIIRFYYFDALKWDAVKDRAGYSWAQVHRIHSDALQKLEEAAGE